MSQASSSSIKTKLYVSAALMVIVAATVWSYSSVQTKRSQQRKKKQAINKSVLEDSTIIIAFEPQNLFIRLRQQGHSQFKPLKKVNSGFINRIYKMFSKQAKFYEQKVSGKNLRKMFKQLKRYDNVKLMIYTKMQKELCSQILDNYGVSAFFEQKNIVTMQSEHKSAEEIDQDTRGVVMISANKQDQSESILGNNHKLILKTEQDSCIDDQIFNKLRCLLLKLLQIGRVDNLHEVMHELAVDMNLPIISD